MELTYHRKGDYLFPNLTVEEEEVTIGKYGMLRRRFLKEHKNSLYQSLFLTGKLNSHLAEYYEENGLDTLSHARTARYEIMYDFARFYDAERCEAYKQLLTLDFYLRENAKSRPLFAGDERISKEEFRLFYDREDEERRYLENYENMEKRQLRKMTHIERFSYDVLGDMKEEECVLLFDYQNRNPLDHQAKVFCVTEEIRELCKQ